MKRKGQSWKKGMSRKEADAEKFRKFLERRGLNPKRKRVWVQIVPGGAPGLGKKA